MSSTTLTDNLYIYSRRWWEAILRTAGDNLGYRHNFTSKGAISQGRTLLVNWSLLTPSSGHSAPCCLNIKTKNRPCLFRSWLYQHPSCLCDHFQVVVDLLTRLEERGTKQLKDFMGSQRSGRTLVPYRQEHSGYRLPILTRFTILNFSTTELHSLSVLEGPGAFNTKLGAAFDSLKGHLFFNPRVALGPSWRTWRHTDGAGRLDSPSASRNSEAQGYSSCVCYISNVECPALTSLRLLWTR